MTKAEKKISIVPVWILKHFEHVEITCTLWFLFVSCDPGFWEVSSSHSIITFVNGPLSTICGAFPGSCCVRVSDRNLVAWSTDCPPFQLFGHWRHENGFPTFGWVCPGSEPSWHEDRCGAVGGVLWGWVNRHSLMWNDWCFLLLCSAVFLPFSEMFKC